MPSFTYQYLKCNDLLWFLYLYLICFYIRKYSEDFSAGSGKYFLCSLLLYLGYAFSVVIIDIAGTVLPVGRYATWFCQKPSIFLFPASVLLILGFKNTAFRCSKVINAVATTMFGVYLIHEHPSVREFVWNHFLPTEKYINSVWFVFYSLAVCVLFFMACIGIEWIRKCCEKSRLGQKIIIRISTLVELLSDRGIKIFRNIARKIIF